MEKDFQDYKKQVDQMNLSDLYDILNHIDREKQEQKYEYIKQKISDLESKDTDQKPTEYAREFDILRRQRRKLIYLFVGFLLVFGLLAIILNKATTDPKLQVVIIVVGFLLYGGYYALSGYRLVQFRCPRCGKHFLKTDGKIILRRSNVWSTKCLNCGLIEN